MSVTRFYRGRLVKDGPFIPVKVFFGAPLIDGEHLDRAPRWQAVIENETTARAVLQLGDDDVPVEIDGATVRNLEPITEADYRFMVADAEHARAWRPDHPKANSREAVDFMKLKPF